MTTDTTAVIEKLKVIIATEFARHRTPGEIRDDEPLVADNLSLDSMGLINLIELVEQTFDFQFEDADLRPATFENIRTLADAICRRTEDNALQI
jgi:acyl carrier protein